ncbi:hypothetical protein B7P43_G03372 [Cryptotermes secundus]|uniref:RRM domain-containing protein n=1 Tax=Cryptotermes secundus TaxID=105785 RepID=A0A2J7QDQ5_9NEOP|nr:uncharacterized protein LOC111868214 [Cryptotermes secundus]PNF26710.1 hypothetical protein B7P43_G03372 [Cryptotermes secundus]
MANMELSLDDIIQKKFSKNSNVRGRRRGQIKRLESGGRGQSLNNTNHVNRRGGFQGRRRANVTGSVADARLRIIQKNRQKLIDARDKLAEIAKQTDARLKLDKLRENRSNSSSNLSRVGASITRRTGRNGQISLSTNKRRTPHNGNKIQERTVTSGGRGFVMAASEMDVDAHIREGLLQVGSTVLRRTVSNDRTSLPPPPLFAPPVQRRSLYTWVNPVPQDSPSSLDEYSSISRSPIQASILCDPVLTSPVVRRGPVQPTSLKIIARNTPQPKHGPTLLSERKEWNYEAQSVKHGNVTPVSRTEPEDSDEDLPLWRQGSVSGSTGAMAGRMSSELKARLDTPVVTPRTMGILSAGSKSANTTPSAPIGHRIVVSNLQTSVTHEDIRELFEDIGPLVTSRLVRPGTAEVVYQLHKDAVKAVDVYHNRQLDGQPMKCMLVNSRPPSIPSAAKNSTSSRSSSGSSFKLPTGGKSSVVPDIGTIHKALFNKS